MIWVTLPLGAHVFISSKFILVCQIFVKYLLDFRLNEIKIQKNDLLLIPLCVKQFRFSFIKMHSAFADTRVILECWQPFGEVLNEFRYITYRQFINLNLNWFFKTKFNFRLCRRIANFVLL